MENNELQAIRDQMAKLEERIRCLETIIDGSSKDKLGRKSKLSLEQKNEIILKHNKGTSYSILAKEYQVSRSTISNICKGHEVEKREDENQDEQIVVPVIRKHYQ